MELEAEIGRMIWEGCPNVEEPGVKNSRFPEVVGRTRETGTAYTVSTVDGITTVADAEESMRLDPVNVRSATAMSGGE